MPHNNKEKSRFESKIRHPTLDTLNADKDNAIFFGTQRMGPWQVMQNRVDVHDELVEARNASKAA